MRIIMPGGSGHLGTLLARAFRADRHDVVVLEPPRGACAVARSRVGRAHRWYLDLGARRRGRRHQPHRPQRRLPVHAAESPGRSWPPARGASVSTWRRRGRRPRRTPPRLHRTRVSCCFVRALFWLIEHTELAGAVDIASPDPLPYREFMRDLRRAAGMPIGLPVSRWMLEIGTWVLRTESELVLKSRRVIPRRLVESGFMFEHPEWGDAVRELVSRQTRSA